MEKFTKVLVEASGKLEDVNVEHGNDGDWIVHAFLPKSGLDLGKMRDLVDVIHENAIACLFQRQGVRIIGKG